VDRSCSAMAEWPEVVAVARWLKVVRVFDDFLLLFDFGFCEDDLVFLIW
jgi:hypothetical protein